MDMLFGFIYLFEQNMEEENIPNPYASEIHTQEKREQIRIDESNLSRKPVNAQGSQIGRHSNISSQNSQSNGQMSRLQKREEKERKKREEGERKQRAKEEKQMQKQKKREQKQAEKREKEEKREYMLKEKELKKQQKEEEQQRKKQEKEQEKSKIIQQKEKQKEEKKQKKRKQKESNEGIPESMICPITQELMKNPVIATECGHTFELSALSKWLSKTPYCPLCKTQVKESRLIKNFALVSLIEDFKKGK